MVKIKISDKAKTLPKLQGYNLKGCKIWSPTAEILDAHNLAKAVSECLVKGDPEGVIEVIEIYQAVNKVQATRQSKLSKVTMYNILKHKNPTIKTLAKLIHATAVR